MKNYSIVVAVVAIALVLAFITSTYNSKEEATPRSAASSASPGPNILPPAMSNTSNKQTVKIGIDPGNMNSQSATILPKK